MFRVWSTQSQVKPALVRLLRGASYHTRNCFGHRVKPAPKNQVKEEWVTRRAALPNLWRLVCAYRDHGHRVADLDPLQLSCSPPLSELDPTSYGLDAQMSVLFPTEGIVHGYPHQEASLSDIIQYLKDAYCGTLTLETAHMMRTEEREWLAQYYEESRSLPLSVERQKALLNHLIKSQTLDLFLAKKFINLKRYGAEGAESMMGFFQEVFSVASTAGVSDVIVGMPHRGRLNLLTGMLQFPHTALFHKIKGNAEFFEGTPGSGDVLSHLASSIALEVGQARGPLYVSLLPNPSHLEAVNPVVMGKARARLLSLSEGQYCSEGSEENTGEDRNKVLTLQIHGDAAFSGQGVVMETLAMMSLPHFSVDGTLHLVVNNQLGFTAESDHGRSSQYCTDVAKMVDAPILHVNGDYPEDVVQATSVAMAYWLRFQNDVVIDMTCFRRWGHNELDNPSLTQPTMYNVIDKRPTVPDLYTNELESVGVLEEGEVSQLAAGYADQLNSCLKEADNHTPMNQSLRDRWDGLEFAPSSITVWDTGVPVDLLKFIGAKSVSCPEDQCKVSKRLKKGHISERLRSMESGVGINWATAEALAFGTLLYQGFNVRLSGQDVGRGTFSHRHAMLVCQESDTTYIPLNHISPEQTAFLEVANSHLSEEAVLGFEYGFSIESPRNLVIWEAQFGDFFNGAQIIIDTFVSSGEAKWLLQSGLVMLLPHGFDGTGPEHSSCRLERFLQMTDSSEAGPDGDDVNMHVVHPTTPAQYFHLLRKQMAQNFRKPLIVASPKTILRQPAAASRLEEMGPGTTFHPVFGDDSIDPKDVARVVLCSGKHYYLLDSHCRELGVKNTAMVRLEQLCPFPSGDIHSHLSRFPNAREFVWSQEEPENMGAWQFVEPRFRRQLGLQLSFAGRKAYPCPATGVTKIHQSEIKQLLADTFPH